jgi:hypothetical protein
MIPQDSGIDSITKTKMKIHMSKLAGVHNVFLEVPYVGLLEAHYLPASRLCWDYVTMALLAVLFGLGRL